MSIYIEAGYELADLGTYVLTVVETGGTGASFAVTLATGTHFLQADASGAEGDFKDRVTGYTPLLDAIVTGLDAGSTATYSATLDKVTERVTLTLAPAATGITSVSFTATTNGGLIGHTTVHSGALTYEMDITPEYWISGDVGFWAGKEEEESDADISFTQRMHDGTPYGVSKDGTATHLNLTIPLEPQASVYTSYASASDPWTWQKLFRHARNVYPIVIDDGTLEHYVKLRRTAFRPLHRSVDYEGHFDIRLETELLARI